MKKLLITAAAIALGVTNAHAADLAPRIYTKAPLSPDNWTGGYVGLSGGGGFGHSNQTDPGGPGLNGEGPGPGAGDGSYSINGGLIGGTIGYNWQVARWVYGFEGDYSWADISGHSDVCGLSAGNPHACGTKLSSLGTLRGRVGYVAGATGNWLLYATGGLAVGEVRGRDALMPASGSELRAGWTVGAGVETAIAPNWTVKVEYLYVDLGKAQMFDILPGIPENVSFNANIVRAGVNYKLPAGKTPVVARASWEPPRDWTGFYVGGHVGGGSASSDLAFQQDVDTWWTGGGSGAVPIRSDGALLGGAQVGFNYQLGSVVAGIEGTWSRLNIKTTVASPFYPDEDTYSARVTSLYTVAARLGVTWDRVLFYGKGGWAGGEVEVSAASTAGPTTWTPGSRSRGGVVVGGGMEYMLTQNLIAGIEYNHIDLGRSNYATFNVGDNSNTTSVDDRTKVDSVVGRLSYKFDSFGAVVGR
jgi:outer membrane immunogenic protein